jgi:hypothetical protein
MLSHHKHESNDLIYGGLTTPPKPEPKPNELAKYKTGFYI